MNSAGFYILQNPAGQFYVFGGQFYGYSKVIAQKLVDEINQTKEENKRLKEILRRIDVNSVDSDVLKMVMEL